MYYVYSPDFLKLGFRYTRRLEGEFFAQSWIVKLHAQLYAFYVKLQADQQFFAQL